VNDEKWHFKSKEEGLARKLQDGITTHIFSGRNIMLSLVEIAPHTRGTVHSHPEEQWGYLLEGECVRVQGGEEVAMTAGHFWYTPANTPHGIRTGRLGATVLDIFSPPRGAYTNPGRGFATTDHAQGMS
jgi:quercetin dioxygenase-like cupin family protein